MSCIFYREKHLDWEMVLPRLIQTLGKKKKKQKPEETSEESDSLKQKIVKNNVEESDEEQGSDDDELEQDSDSSDRESDEENSNEEEEENSDENTFVSSLKEALGTKEKKNSKVSQVSKVEKVEGESVVKMLDLKSSDADIDLMQTQEKAGNPQLKTGSLKRSSFFLGGESDESEEDEDDQTDAESDDEGMKEEVRVGGFRNKKFEEKEDGYRNKKIRPTYEKSEKKDPDRQKYKRDQNGGGNRKQFQKATSVKKNKFNKGTDRPFSSQGKDRNRATNVNKKTPEVKEESRKVVDVHPSWEAKQKQKPSIQTFQGKKTVFE